MLVVHRVATNGMARLAHAPEQSPVSLGMAANDKERGGHLTLLQTGQHPRGDVSMGAIVEGQMHLM